MVNAYSEFIFLVSLYHCSSLCKYCKITISFGSQKFQNYYQLCCLYLFFVVLLQAQSELKRVQHDQSRNSHSQKTSDVKLKEMKDQLIRAKVYLSFVPQGSKSHFVKEIKLRIKELERAMGGVTKDSDLSRR